MVALLLSLSLLAAEEESTATVRGVVKDAQGNPVAGAQVVSHPLVHGKKPIRSEADERGEFELAGVPVVHDRVRLLAYKPGLAIGELLLTSPQQRAAPLEIKLPSAEPMTLTVHSPRGEPVAGAEISIEGYQRDENWWLTVEWDAFVRTTNAEGKVTIDWLAKHSSPVVIVKTKDLGTQRIFVAAEQNARTLRLRPVGRLEGQIAAADPKAGAEVDVQVSTRSWETGGTSGEAKVKSDDKGRFVVEHLAEGEATLSIGVHKSLPFRLADQPTAKVVAGQTTTLEIPLVDAVKIAGKVVDEETKQPIAGVKLWLSNRMESEEVVSGKDGTFQALLGPGVVQHGNLREVPDDYLPSQLINFAKLVAPGTKEFTFPPIELPRAVAREGTVVDEEGKPVANAWVTATWVQRHEQYSTMLNRSTKTDDSGKFVLRPLAASAQLHFRAETRDGASESYTVVAPGAKDPIRLVVTPAGGAVLAGRVIDRDGKPVADAAVQINFGFRNIGNREYLQGEEYDNQWMLRTSAEGRFQTPHPVPRILEPESELKPYVQDTAYYVTVKAPGKLEKRTTFRLQAGPSPVQMPDIVLEEVTRVRGRVVDDAGKPIPGATVSAPGPNRAPVTATSDPAGNFALDGIHPQARFVFARHQDYRLRGTPIVRGEEATLTLTRLDAEAKPLVAVRHSAQEQRERLRKLLMPVYEKHWDKLHPSYRAKILELLAPHDREFVVGEVSKIADARYRAQLLAALGQFDDAEAAALSSDDPLRRAYALLDISRAHPHLLRKRDLLSEVLLQSKSVIDPQRRLGLACSVAEALYDLGDKAAAKKIVDDNLKEIEALEAGFYRGYIAETVALFDVDKALALCAGATNEFEPGRHPGNIAHELAATDPARAEAILKTISKQGLSRYASRVAWRMAPVDLPRAKSVAEMTPNDYARGREHALGLVALAVFPQNPQEARQILRQSFDALDRDLRSVYDARNEIPTAMALVHFSETVDPEATEEYVWRTIRLFPTTPESPDVSWVQQHRQLEARLAILLWRYGIHSEVAAELSDPFFSQTDIKSHDLNQSAAFFAMGMASVDRSAAWVEGYFARTKGDELRYIPQPWELMAEAVAGDDKAFWDSLHERVLHLWIVDREDL